MKLLGLILGDIEIIITQIRKELDDNIWKKNKNFKIIKNKKLHKVKVFLVKFIFYQNKIQKKNSPQKKSTKIFQLMQKRF